MKVYNILVVVAASW